MADQEHLHILRQGIGEWNTWRDACPERQPDLSGVDLSNTNLSGANLSNTNLIKTNLSGTDFSGALLRGALLSGTDLSEALLKGADLSNVGILGTDLSGTNLSGVNFGGALFSDVGLETEFSVVSREQTDLNDADLSKTDLSGAYLRAINLSGADLSEANLSGADFSEANLSGADLSGANLSGADLSGANLSRADLSGANLSRADLSKTILIGTNFTEATLTDCTIYGIAAWNIQLENAIQKNLIITQPDEPTLTIDNLKVAQFIYLMLNNKEIRDVINALTTKTVLILGRFTKKRKPTLDALREALRTHNYLPIVFDFKKPSNLDLTETVTTLAHLSRFVIIDLTDPRSSPYEAASIIPHSKVPIQPIIIHSQKTHSMFSDFKLYPWVLKPYSYQNTNALIASLKKEIIEPAERKAEELEQLKNSTEENSSQM